MKVSVIIPTFNRCSTLSRAIQSVVDQTFDPMEIIVVDDGSTDKTPDLLLSTYPQVTVITQPNKGVSAARNAGLLQAKGDWVALLDSDDEWLPNKLARQVDSLQQNPGLHVSHTDEIWIRNGVRVNSMKHHEKPDGEIFNACLPLCCVSPSSILIHRSVFDDVGGFDESLPACEDYDLWLRVFCRYSVKLVPEKLLRKYGGHEDQLSRQHWGMDRFRIQSLHNLLQSGVLNKAQTEAAQTTLIAKCHIMAQGAAKRQNTDRHGYYVRLGNQYCVDSS